MKISQIFFGLLTYVELSHGFVSVRPSIHMPHSHKTRSFSTSHMHSKSEPSDEYDVVIVGSGIGGLSCAAMLCLYNYKVAVFESHYSAGGVAHGYSVKKGDVEYHFDTGPSFFSGLNPNMPAKLSNPLRTVLDAIDEKVECIPYTSFGLHFPEGKFIHTPSFGEKGGTLEQISSNASKEWETMMKKIEPLAAAVDALPTAALRGDVAVALTAAPFLKNFIKTNPLENLKLTKPFSSVLEETITDTFTRNWLDLLCFCLSGLPSNGTITAEMAMMIPEFYDKSAVMDCPKGGAKSIINALVRGIENRGGKIFLNSHVEKINIESGKATGIKLSKSGKSITAKKGVVSNLSVWDLFSSGIVDKNEFPDAFVKERMSTPVGKSFMHLHVGFKATRRELEKLQAHYMYIDDWNRGVESEDNAVLISIPSVHDETLASEGYAVLHAYTPATESYERWAGLDRKSDEYKKLKEERSQYLWNVLEKIIPDIRDRVEHVQIGTPLTHERFNRRYKGSYGAAINASEGSFPFPGTPIKNLLVCGDSCFPGIGVPAVAGSGLLTANSVSLDSLKSQLQVLENLRQKHQ